MYIGAVYDGDICKCFADVILHRNGLGIRLTLKSWPAFIKNRTAICE